MPKFKCPQCNGNMVLRNSNFGLFWSCINFPKCTGNRDFKGNSPTEIKLRKKKESKDENHC